MVLRENLRDEGIYSGIGNKNVAGQQEHCHESLIPDTEPLVARPSSIAPAKNKASFMNRPSVARTIVGTSHTDSMVRVPAVVVADGGGAASSFDAKTGTSTSSLKRPPSCNATYSERKESSTKRLKNTPVSSEQRNLGLLSIPQEVRWMILSFAVDETILDTYCKLSRRCFEDAQHLHRFRPKEVDMLSRAVMVTNQLDLRNSMITLCRMLSENRYDHKTSLLIFANYDHFEKVTVKALRDVLRKLRLYSIRTLDMSLRTPQKIKVCVQNTLSQIVPECRKVIMDNCIVTRQAAIHFSNRCIFLQSLHWARAGKSLLFLDGKDLQQSHYLKELFLDFTVFQVSEDDEASDSLEIFTYCNHGPLERVSLLEAEYQTGFRKPVKPVPERWIIRFVLDNPSVNWLRASLSTQGIASIRAACPKRELTLITEERWFP